MSDNYLGNIFRVAYHKVYPKDYNPKSNKERMYVAKSRWAHDEQGYNFEQYVGDRSPCLFNGQKDLDKNDIKQIRKMSRELNVPVYDCVFSFGKQVSDFIKDDETAKDAIQSTFDKFLKLAGLKPDNIEWVAGIHTDRNHIHAHIKFFEKEKQYLDSFGNLRYKTEVHQKIPKKTLDMYRSIVTEEIVKNKYDYNFKNVVTSFFKQQTRMLSASELATQVSKEIQDFSIKKYKDLPDAQKVKVNFFIDKIFDINPNLKLIKDEFENTLDLLQENYNAIGQVNESKEYVKKHQKFKEKELEKLHNRFGDLALATLAYNQKSRIAKRNHKINKTRKIYGNDVRLIRSKAIEINQIEKENKRLMNELINSLVEYPLFKKDYKTLDELIVEQEIEEYKEMKGETVHEVL